MQECSVCKQDKEFSCFYRSKAYKSGYGYRCKDCDKKVRAVSRSRSPATQEGYRRRSLANKYGMEMGQYEAMLASQGGCCAICSTTNPLGEGNTTAKRSFSFAVDHCHTTGKIRGLLCNPCNRGIGFLQDNPALLETAANYLRR